MLNYLAFSLALAATTGSKSLCPETIFVEQTAIGEAPEGMQFADSRQEHRMEGVLVFIGVPENGMQVVTDVEDSDQSRETIWTVDADTWFSCVYRGTSAKVQGQVDPRFKECRFIHDKKNFTRMFRCRE